MSIKTNKGKIFAATMATLLWLLSLGMIIFDIDRFPFTPTMVFNIGLLFSFTIIFKFGRKEITFKQFLPRLLLFFVLIGIYVLLVIYVPFLGKQPPQPYRSIIVAMVVLPLVTYLWWSLFKSIKRKA